MQTTIQNIQNTMLGIVQNINKGMPAQVRQLSEQFSTLLFCDSLEQITPAERCEYMTVFYKLLLHLHSHTPKRVMAYHMVSGILQFGQSAAGANYQPLLDHLLMELFDNYTTTTGWSILKPFTNTLRNNIRHIEQEQIFNHIIDRIITQLYYDEEHGESSSDLCYNLPREKSFNWGWFSYYIAVAYKNPVPRQQQQPQTKKSLRGCMMRYRNLITTLRNVQREYVTIEENEFGFVVEPETSQAQSITPCPSPTQTDTLLDDLDATWDGVLNMVENDKYMWVDNVIRVSLYWSPLPATITTTTAAEPCGVTTPDIAVVETMAASTSACAAANTCAVDVCAADVCAADSCTCVSCAAADAAACIKKNEITPTTTSTATATAPAPVEKEEAATATTPAVSTTPLNGSIKGSGGGWLSWFGF